MNESRNPDMFRRADLMIITKIDLLPYVDFDVKQCLDFASRIKPNLETLLLSAKSGEGMSAWTDWIKQKRT